jgi:hypothetical protein
MSRSNMYNLLSLLNERLRGSLDSLKRLESCPGQRVILLAGYRTEIEYLLAQINFEVTSEASSFEEKNTARWGRKVRRLEQEQRDPDDVFLEAEERDKERRKMGLPARIVVLPWSYEEDQRILAAREIARKRKGRKARQRTSRTKSDGSRLSRPAP